MVSRKQLVKKWESAKGKMSIANEKSENIKSNLACLLENQENLDLHAGELMQEVSKGAINTGSVGGYTDGVAASDSYIFKPIALALVRRTFPDLFANKVAIKFDM